MTRINLKWIVYPVFSEGGVELSEQLIFTKADFCWIKKRYPSLCSSLDRKAHGVLDDVYVRILDPWTYKCICRTVDNIIDSEMKSNGTFTDNGFELFNIWHKVKIKDPKFVEFSYCPPV